MSGRIGQEARATASCPKVCRDPAPISGIPTHRILLRHPLPSSFSEVERPSGCAPFACQSRPRKRNSVICPEHRKEVLSGIQPIPDTIRFPRGSVFSSNSRGAGTSTAPPASVKWCGARDPIKGGVSPSDPLLRHRGATIEPASPRRIS